MSEATIIFFLSICVAILVCVIIYQQFAFRTQAKLDGISQKLEEILDTDSDEKVMVFTDNPSLISLATQITAAYIHARTAAVLRNQGRRFLFEK